MDKSLGNPVIYIFLTVIHASIISGIIKHSLIGAAIFVASFCVFLYIMQNKKIIIINIVLFIITIINCYVYYNLKVEPNSYIEVRISDKLKKDIIAQSGNRRIKVIGSNNLELNRMYYIKGTYTENIDLESRTTGEIKIKNIIKGKEDVIYKVSRYRNVLAEKIKNNMGKEESELLLASAIGLKSELSYENKKLLNSIGIAHIISLSGLHVMIISIALRKVLGEKLSIVVLFLYIVFTGFITSAIRAFIMIFIMRLGNMLSKKYNSLAALALGGTLMLLYKPYYIFDIGFVLSYLATLGIVLLNKRINRGMYKLPNKIRDITSISLAANAFTFPYISMTIKKFSVFFLIGNLFIVPLFTPIIVMGNFLILIQYFPTLFKLTCTILNYICAIILYFSRLINEIGIEPIEINETIAGVYCMCFMAYYFYNKGYKDFIKLYYITPLYAIISFGLQYSSIWL